MIILLKKAFLKTLLFPIAIRLFRREMTSEKRAVQKIIEFSLCFKMV